MSLAPLRFVMLSLACAVGPFGLTLATHCPKNVPEDGALPWERKWLVQYLRQRAASGAMPIDAGTPARESLSGIWNGSDRAEVERRLAHGGFVREIRGDGKDVWLGFREGVLVGFVTTFDDDRLSEIIGASAADYDAAT